MMTLSQARRPRALALFALLALLGCSQSGQSAPPATQISPPETVTASPVAAAPAQPAANPPAPVAPPPAPATFDVSSRTPRGQACTALRGCVDDVAARSC